MQRPYEFIPALRPKLGALPSSNELAVAWDQGTLRSDVMLVFDDNEVEFTMVGPFRIENLCRINGEDPAALVIAVQRACLTL